MPPALHDLHVSPSSAKACAGTCRGGLWTTVMTVLPSSRASVLLSSGGSDGRRRNWCTSVRCPPRRAARSAHAAQQLARHVTHNH